jgi:hypothetical protein
MVVFSTGAMAAPITAFSRIDQPELVSLATDLPEAHWQSALIFLGPPLDGEIRAPDVPPASESAEAMIGLPEPPTALMSFTGFGVGGQVLWRRLQQRRKRRRRTRIEMREMASLF